MAVLAIVPVDVTRYPNHPIVAGTLAFAFTAPTVAGDGVEFPITGRELIVLQNANAGAQTFTIASTRDEYGRLGDVTTYSMAAGTFAFIPVGAQKLFGTTGGKIVITMSHVDIKVAVLRLPNLV